jgi:hypothetical protein
MSWFVCFVWGLVRVGAGSNLLLEVPFYFMPLLGFKAAHCTVIVTTGNHTMLLQNGLSAASTAAWCLLAMQWAASGGGSNILAMTEAQAMHFPGVQRALTDRVFKDLTEDASPEDLVKLAQGTHKFVIKKILDCIAECHAQQAEHGVEHLLQQLAFDQVATRTFPSDD